MKSRYFSSKKRFYEDTPEDSAHRIVSSYKASKLRRKLNQKFGAGEIANDATVCPICLDDCRNQCSPNGCNHIFCFDCISEWGKVSPICPLCKVEFQIVCDPAGRIMGSFEKKNHDDGEIASEGDDYEDYGDEDVTNILQLQDRSHGYQLDGFVVDDDFVEFDEI